MSHFSEIKVDFDQKQEKELITALENKFGKGTVEVHPDGSALRGFQGDDRSLKVGTADYAPPCHLIIRRKNVGGSSNDVGYRKLENGKYGAYISEFDKQQNFKKDAQNRVAQDYAERVSLKQLKAKGYSVKRVEENGTVKLIASKYS